MPPKVPDLLAASFEELETAAITALEAADERSLAAVDQALHLIYADRKNHPETRGDLLRSISRIVESHSARKLELTPAQTMATKWEHLHALIDAEEAATPLVEEARQFLERSDYGWRVLKALRDGPKPRKALRELVGGDSNTSQVLSRMEARGLIVRTPGADGRSIEVALGPLGEEILGPRPVLHKLAEEARTAQPITLKTLQAAS